MAAVSKEVWAVGGEDDWEDSWEASWGLRAVGEASNVGEEAS
jgi:hypothetical protein